MIDFKKDMFFLCKTDPQSLSKRNETPCIYGISNKDQQAFLEATEFQKAGQNGKNRICFVLKTCKIYGKITIFYYSGGYIFWGCS